MLRPLAFILLAFPALCALFNDQRILRAPKSERKILTPQIDADIDQILAEFHSPGGVGIALVHRSLDSRNQRLRLCASQRHARDRRHVLGDRFQLDILAAGIGVEERESGHGGSVLGFKSQVTRFPSQDLGVAVLSNDEAFGGAIMEAIKFRLVDEYLGLEPIDWTARYRAQAEDAFKHRPQPTPRPSDPDPPFMSFSQLAGRYTNGGYGMPNLSLVSPAELSGDIDPDCTEVIEEIPTALPGIIDAAIPIFLVRWRVFGGLTHVALTHFNGDVYIENASAPFWVNVQAFTGAYAHFSKTDSGDGVGVAMQGVWGAGTGVGAPGGDTVEGKAEVWFDEM
ncbi:Beta-lactamase/transpeptidase-like protein [Mycena kentingensis (nom. inval.)]|nr:Beta-lactamase/transpeptidase-like protein [Mycena kentingensis (nom. inval.)]